jgi:hypothetical protein
MTKLIDRLKLVFLGVFAVACLAVWGYQWFVVGPERRCEDAGNWWDPQGHECAVPIDVRSFTGIGNPHLSPAGRSAATPAANAPATPAPAAATHP